MNKITYNTKIDNHIIEIEKEKNKKRLYNLVLL